MAAMKISHAFPSFACGIMIAIGFTVFAQAKPSVKDGAQTWAVASVDTAAIRLGFDQKMPVKVVNAIADRFVINRLVKEEPKFAQATDQAVSEETERRINAAIADRDVQTSAEETKEIKALSEAGYEPFAASAFNGGIYNNEKLWFFRKKLK